MFFFFWDKKNDDRPSVAQYLKAKCSTQTFQNNIKLETSTDFAGEKAKKKKKMMNKFIVHIRYLPANLNFVPILMLAFQLIPKEILVVNRHRNSQRNPLEANHLIDLTPYNFAMQTVDLIIFRNERDKK